MDLLLKLLAHHKAPELLINKSNDFTVLSNDFKSRFPSLKKMQYRRNKTMDDKILMWFYYLGLNNPEQSNLALSLEWSLKINNPLIKLICQLFIFIYQDKTHRMTHSKFWDNYYSLANFKFEEFEKSFEESDELIFRLFKLLSGWAAFHTEYELSHDLNWVLDNFPIINQQENDSILLKFDQLLNRWKANHWTHKLLQLLVKNYEKLEIKIEQNQTILC